MLIQMPRGPSGGEPPKTTKAECTPFEAALRRDLANAPVVAYETLIGGWAKRIFDLVVVILTAPVWLAIIAAVAAVVKVRHPAPVLLGDERIGYGGDSFNCFRLRLSPPTAVIERLHPPALPSGEPPAEARGEGRAAKWREALERLPQLINVLNGDMSLVGPRPLARDEVEALRTPRRYYLSARPGIIGIGSGEGDENVGGPYKVYALSWSLWHDVLIVWRAVRDFRDRGELWRPSWRLHLRDTDAAVLARRRTS